ncbi:MAG: HAD family hydrolase [Anaerolineae bacterium]|nr:HAD family hydrolase [Anaerolineae bacterium]
MKLLLWDFDETLGYRHGGAWMASLFEVLQREAPECPATMDELETFTRAGFPWHTPEVPHPHLDSADTWWEALEPVFVDAYVGVGLRAERARAMAKLVRPTYLDLARWRLYEDTEPTLRALTEAGWTHAILSNHVPELETLVNGLGLSSVFARVFNSALTGYEKPHPEAYRTALRAFPDAMVRWMIGDSYRADVLGAAAVGIPSVLVHKPHPDASRYAATLAEVPGML